MLQDAIRMAAQVADKDTQIILTREDVTVTDAARNQSGASYAFRCNRSKQGLDTFAPMVDMFSAPLDFWVKVFPEVPDVVMGLDAFWPRLLMEIFKNTEQSKRKECFAMSEIVLQQPKPAPPRIARNRVELEKYLTSNKIQSLWPAVEQQKFSYVIKGLPQNSYNPSIIRFRGRLVVAYRFHETTLKTKIGLAELDETSTSSTRKC